MNKISVIIPNHSNKNIDKLINEVKKFKPLEIIIVNNKSETVKSNNTSDILKYYNISERKNVYRPENRLPRATNSVAALCLCLQYRASLTNDHWHG